MIFDVLLYDILVWYWSDLEWISVILLIHHSYHPSQHLAPGKAQTVRGSMCRTQVALHQGPVLRRVEVPPLLPPWISLAVSVKNLVGGNQWCMPSLFAGFSGPTTQCGGSQDSLLRGVEEHSKYMEVAAHFTESITPNMFAETTTFICREGLKLQIVIGCHWTFF